MATLDANVDLTAVDRAMGDVEQRAKRMAPAFRELKKPLQGENRSHAKDQRAPGGTWPARSPLTEARRKVRNRGIRSTKASRMISLGKVTRRRTTPKNVLGRLPKAVRVVVGELFIRATSMVEWSGIHQFGGTAGKHAKIPQRMFLWLSTRFVDEARGVLIEHVWKDWKK